MTPTRSSGPYILVDTSAAVALVVDTHAGHAETFDALASRRLGLAGNAAFETISVLTRLPPPARRSVAAVMRLLTENFPATRFLSARAARDLLPGLARERIAGGAVYDALVAATAAEHRVPLATRDRRALETYRAFDIEIEVIGDQ